MDERDKRRVGEEIEPGGRPKAPGRLELLQRFVNSYNHDFPAEWDRIGTGERAQAWLRRKRLVGPGDHVSDADAARLRELREAIRALALPTTAARHRRPARRRRSGRSRPEPGSRSRWTTLAASRWCRPGAAPTVRSRPARHPPRGAAELGDWCGSRNAGSAPAALLRPSCNRSGRVVRDGDPRQTGRRNRAHPTAASAYGPEMSDTGRAAGVTAGPPRVSAVLRLRRRGSSRVLAVAGASVAVALRCSSARAARARQRDPGGGVRHGGARPQHGPWASPACSTSGTSRSSRSARTSRRWSRRPTGPTPRAGGVAVLVGEPAAGMPGIHVNFLLVLVLAVVVTTTAGVLIGIPTLRLRGAYVGIVTLAFGEVIGQVAANGQDYPVVRGDPDGRAERDRRPIDSIDLPFLAPFGPLDLRPWYWFALVLVGLTLPRQRPAARLASGPRVDRGARRRGRRPRARGSRSRRRSSARTASAPRRRGHRRVPRVLPELRSTPPSSRSRSRSSSS